MLWCNNAYALTSFLNSSNSLLKLEEDPPDPYCVTDPCRKRATLIRNEQKESCERSNSLCIH